MAEQTLSQSEIELPKPPFSQGPGALLKQAREACRFTPEEIAQQLRLGVQRIHEIENNDFSQMKAVIYAQGYLRAYADLVKLPVEKVLEAFKSMEWAQQKNQSVEQVCANNWVRKSLPLSRPSSRLWIYLSSAILAFVVVLVVLDYWPTEEFDALAPSVPVKAVAKATSVKETSASVIPLAALPKETTDDSAENPFVQSLAPMSSVQQPAKKSASAPIIEAQPVTSTHKAAR